MITIVILIILATVTINTIFGENGLIKKAEKAKEMAEQATRNEEEGMNALLGEFAETMGELPVAPKLSDGMVPVKWNGTNWVKTTAEDKEWYNYGNKQWANVVLTPTSGEKEGKDATGEVDVFNADVTLNEDSAYSMLVWIPRYAYQITSGYHQSGAEINPSDGTKGAGNINIVFIDTENKNLSGTKTYSETYPNYETGTGMYGVAEEGCEAGYVVHPAFNFGDTKLAGFWVGKYETSNTNCTQEASTGRVSYVGNEIVTIKAGVTCWRNIAISDMFTVGINLNKEENPYGLNTSDDVVDPHMMKNTEWGAMAYLSQNSKYGKGSEVIINDNSSYLTADGDYKTNENQSTTGNIWGVFDMSGGSREYVSAYVNNGNPNLTIYGETLKNADAKYKDVYQASATYGTSDTTHENYDLSIPNNGIYGDAIYEVSSGTQDAKAWYLDGTGFPNSNNPFFHRGGYYGSNNMAGVFAYGFLNGNKAESFSFRLVIPVK